MPTGSRVYWRQLEVENNYRYILGGEKVMTTLASVSVRNKDVAWNERCDELVARERAKFFLKLNLNCIQAGCIFTLS